MRIYYHLFLPVFIAALFSCSRETGTERPSAESAVEETGSSDSYIPGIIRIKVSDKLADAIERSASGERAVTKTSVNAVDEVLSSLNADSLERTFPYAGKFEARTRKEGLHRWYDIHFDKSVPVTRASADLSSLSGIENVEYIPRVKVSDYSIKRAYGAGATGTSYFDDPKLPSQWHYFNNETAGYYRAGCDVNVLPVWKSLTTGDSDVIVAVVDGAVDYNHEDLKDNMWVNERELNGVASYDDDGNGFVDDVYGYNFVDRKGQLDPDDHGTHVAGTIAAVNDNGVGVSGLAGGDYRKGVKGVRIMSAEIFSGKNSTDNTELAIKYGADNGAVICQNSWGYEAPAYSTPQSVKDAIDYFIKYAGVDENGDQTGPMKGGIVIFAAGNDNLETSYPASYESCLAVAALGADYERAYYSNFGSAADRWVDISAPGGDAVKGPQILSTIKNNQYGYMQGTSMACPHVSGVAALIVSYCKGPGFTSAMLRERLVSTAFDVDEYNPTYKGFLGAGLVNAYRAITGYVATAPDSVAKLSASVLSNNIDVAFTVPEDKDDGQPIGFHIYYSRDKFGPELDRNKLPDNVKSSRLLLGEKSPGDEITKRISSLEFNADYYVAVDAYDKADNLSSLSEVVKVTTKGNNPPVISPAGDVTITMKSFEKKTLDFTLSDPDDHTLTWDFVPGSAAASAYDAGNSGVQVVIYAPNAAAGEYDAVLTAGDKYGGKVSITIHYVLLPNTPPEVLSAMENKILAPGESFTVNLNDFFKDDDGETLKFAPRSAKGISTFSQSKGVLTVTAITGGIDSVSVVATDAAGSSCGSYFYLLARDASKEADLYPNPVSDKLNIRMGAETDASVRIIGSGGNVFYEGDIHISPFKPAVVDVSAADSGVYSVIIEAGGKTVRSSIIKI